jgi:hypothetical protein
LRKLLGNTEIEDSLQRLDKLTQEEARMASAELLKVTNGIDGNVQDISNRVQYVDDRIQGVNDKLEQVDRSLPLYPLLIFRRLRYYYREPAQRQPLTMAFAIRPIHKS